jgi:hypothetical protein
MWNHHHEAQSFVLGLSRSEERLHVRDHRRHDLGHERWIGFE